MRSNELLVEFNRPLILGDEINYISDALSRNKLSGGAFYGKKCEQILTERLNAKCTFLTPSCTAALEFCALLLDIRPGDEVIVPSFTFVTSALAFVNFGAKIRFVDIDPKTLCSGVEQIESAITAKTKAILTVHYAGLSADVPALKKLADDNGIILIEDAAQALGAYFGKIPLGSIGHLATFSFHETKNITSGGEGGALVINDPSLVERAHIIREKGTNRKKFFEGRVDKYSWVEKGSSYLLNEVSAAYLYPQLLALDEINAHRVSCCSKYGDMLSSLLKAKGIEYSNLISTGLSNGHLFYLMLPNRSTFINRMRELGIETCFHYVPLHQSEAGKKYSTGTKALTFSEKAGTELVRLPMHGKLVASDLERVCYAVEEVLSIW